TSRWTPRRRVTIASGCAGSSSGPRPSAARRRSATTAWSPTRRWRPSWWPSSVGGSSDELPLAAGLRDLRADAAAGPALLPQGAPARAPGVEPAAVGGHRPRPRGLDVLPAAAARPAADPPDPGPAGADAGAGAAGGHRGGRG